MTEPTLLQPEPATIVVSFHPQHHHGDRVSLKFTDAATGLDYQLVADPDTTDYLSRLFASAVKSPRITQIADQMKAAQRDG